MKSSRGEIKISEILDMNDIQYQEEYTFNGLNSENGRALRFDFCVFDDDGKIDFLIEYQGKQHYQPVSKYGGTRAYYQQKFNDDKKRRFCALHNIKLIEIPYTEEHLITYDYIMKKAGY